MLYFVESYSNCMIMGLTHNVVQHCVPQVKLWTSETISLIGVLFLQENIFWDTNYWLRLIFKTADSEARHCQFINKEHKPYIHLDTQGHTHSAPTPSQFPHSHGCHTPHQSEDGRTHRHRHAGLPEGCWTQPHGLVRPLSWAASVCTYLLRSRACFPKVLETNLWPDI